jgi:hypothetical protein
MEEDPLAPGATATKLYFPAYVFFGKVHALPGPEEAEFLIVTLPISWYVTHTAMAP